MIFGTHIWYVSDFILKTGCYVIEPAEIQQRPYQSSKTKRGIANRNKIKRKKVNHGKDASANNNLEQINTTEGRNRGREHKP